MTQARTPFAELAHRRRSNLRIDPDLTVDDELLDGLIAIAATAPNHHRTHPWRFRIITGEGRRGLGEALAEGLLADPVDDPDLLTARVAKARSKYLRAPVMLVVASAAGADEIGTLENRDAVSAAIQTLLLAATEVGLASLWSTGEAARSTEVALFCDLDPTDTIVGLIYLGWPTAELDPVVRPMPEVARIDRA
ncbi:MAG: nitroreductase [Actinobacteria bacterium]|nr:nitroreductase [Actinomycetota bacterium]